MSLPGYHLPYPADRADRRFAEERSEHGDQGERVAYRIQPPSHRSDVRTEGCAHCAAREGEHREEAGTVIRNDQS